MRRKKVVTTGKLIMKSGRPIVTPPSGLIYPPSIITPSVGTSLVPQFDLQIPGAVGPRYAYSNGVWDHEVPIAVGYTPVSQPYLASKNFVYNNNGAYWLWVPDNATVVVEKFDFTGSPSVYTFGNNITVIFRDCKGISEFSCNRDVNGNTIGRGQNVTLLFEYTDFDAGAIHLQCNVTFEQRYCSMRNQPAILWTAGAAHVSTIRMFVHHNFLTGGGVNDPYPAHIETIQMQPDDTAAADNCYFHFEDNMVWTKDGQATNDNGYWTGYFSFGKTNVRIRNNVFKGFPDINTNPFRANIFSSMLAFGDTSAPYEMTLENNALDAGVLGFGHNHTDGGTYVAPVGVGNRTFLTDTPITSFN